MGVAESWGLGTEKLDRPVDGPLDVAAVRFWPPAESPSGVALPGGDDAFYLAAGP
ncbi:hypothetical protein ACFW6V_25795 [Streptomyces sp. NPDC058734]|uniref:hypothetical protein n=1 Tax=Streptomyces sp. NPDC058734 TaxID=3346615 RepID=UPI0036942086